MLTVQFHGPARILGVKNSALHDKLKGAWWEIDEHKTGSHVIRKENETK
jgi:hypothetical protein